MGRMSAYTGRALKWDWVMKASKLDIRAYPDNPLYPQGKPDACVVGQKRSQRGANHASEHFWPAALASNSAIGGQVFARPHNETVIRISSKSAEV